MLGVPLAFEGKDHGVRVQGRPVMELDPFAQLEGLHQTIVRNLQGLRQRGYDLLRVAVETEESVKGPVRVLMGLQGKSFGRVQGVPIRSRSYDQGLLTTGRRNSAGNPEHSPEENQNPKPPSRDFFASHLSSS